MCKWFGHKNKTVAYGYPPFKRIWHTIKRCQRCGSYLVETDDLFVEKRSKRMRFDVDYMTYKATDIPYYVTPWRNK